MNIAIVLHGNLRTFLMPLRENENLRVYDKFHELILAPNNDPDIFIATETDDFYYDGKQFANQVELYHPDPFRMYYVTDKIEHEPAKDIITYELNRILGDRIKAMQIDPPMDATQDEKYEFFKQIPGHSKPSLIIKQHKRIKIGYNLLVDYEQKNNKKYDIILRCRFDGMYGGPLYAASHDYVNNDMYVAGIRGPVIYDWASFGNRHGMHYSLSVYDHLGIAGNEPRYLGECLKDNALVSEEAIPEGADITCPVCKTNDRIGMTGIANSSEHHLYTIYKKYNIRYRVSSTFCYLYRYRAY